MSGVADRPGFGFDDVDRSRVRAAMVAGMDTTARWPAVHAFPPGAGGGAGVEFVQGDATNRELPDATFDACRSERTLQWVSDPAGAIRQFVRVTRPGGRVTVTDTDWRTFIVDHPDSELTVELLEGLAAFRGPGYSVGGRLVNLLRDAGATHVEASAARHVWTVWDPDRSPTAGGFVPLRALADDLVASGVLGAADLDRFIESFEDAARRDRLFMALTMFSAAGLAP